MSDQAIDVLAFAAKAGAEFLTALHGAINTYKTTGKLPDTLLANEFNNEGPGSPKKAGRKKLPKLNKDGSVRQPRKPTAYNVWMQTKLKELKSASDYNPEEKHADTFKRATQAWADMPADEKAKFSAEFKEAHTEAAAHAAALAAEEAAENAAAAQEDSSSSEGSNDSEDSSSEDESPPAPAPKPAPKPVAVAPAAEPTPKKKKKKREEVKHEEPAPVPIATDDTHKKKKKKKNKE